MIAPLLAVLLQSTDASPVRVWLDATGPLVRGSAVRVYVQVAEDGNLVVLQRRTDGRIAVLFPAKPGHDPLLRAGTYEISSVVSEPDGAGTILAALSPDPLRFDEFTRAVDWNPDALVPSWGGADPEGALSDIVQRMLGGGYFNYDFVTYTVAPAVQARQDMPPETVPYSACLGCTLIGVQLIIAEPFFTCDAFFGSCRVRRLHRHATLCGTKSPCVQQNARVMALASIAGTPTGPLQRGRQVVVSKPGGASPSLEPRRRPSNARTRRPAPAAVARSASAASTVSMAAAAPRRHVRFTRLLPPVVAEPRVAGTRRSAAIAAPRRAIVATRAPLRSAVATAGTWPARSEPLARSAAIGGGAMRSTRAIVLPRIARPASGVRMGPAPAARRR